MRKTTYIILVFFTLCSGLMLIGCPKKTVVKEEPSVVQQEAVSVGIERQTKEKETRELREREEKEKARAEALKEETQKEFERSLVAQKTPGIEGEVFESSLLRMIHFDFDKYHIRPQDADILKQNAEVLKRFPNVKIQIEGHCDERGTEEYNLALGERRANSTKRYLISLGIASDRISTISYGEERPIDPAQNEEAWAKNRRAQFVVISK